MICKPFFSSYLVQVETAETGNKNCCLTEARHVLRRKLSFRAFPERFCPRRLLLENVDYFETLKYVNSSVVGEKKRRIIIMKRLTGLVLQTVTVCK